MKNCRHCSRPYIWMERGLCRSCYKNPDVKCLYAKLPCGGSRQKKEHRENDETEAELEALIASRRHEMPGGDRRRPVGTVDVPRCVLAGRGFRVTHRREVR